MYILNRDEIREWDAYTILHEPVTSVDLMERAAIQCAEWIAQRIGPLQKFIIFCGKGNNGGDGLAIARLLYEKGYPVSVYVLASGKEGSADFDTNLQKLLSSPIVVSHIDDQDDFPVIETGTVVVDALFGTGLNKPLEGAAAQLVEYINSSIAFVISIDLPSGLFIDQSSKGNSIIRATYTLTFQCLKTGLLVQENAIYIGEVHVLDIGLDLQFLEGKIIHQEFIEPSLVQAIYKPRNAFAHKGNFGHALIIAGSYGKMGAAVLAAKACLCSGAGLTTVYAPKCGYNILQVAIPEAMVFTDENENFVSTLPMEIEKYESIGIGPGIGTQEPTQNLLSFIVRRYKKPIVLDADALNCLAVQTDLFKQLPPDSILTPHPKEFDRMFGEHADDFIRIQTARQKAKELNIILVVKGHHSVIATPGGQVYFNSTGNAGMAKGGSGDILTGIITALLAQGYTAAQAAILGVYLHGLAGDIAAKDHALESLTATDLINGLSTAFRKFY